MYESGVKKVFTDVGYKYLETVLQPTERIVGIKTHFPTTAYAYHCSFQFVIGKGFDLTAVKVL